MKFIGTLNLKVPVCQVISDQLTRSGCSVLANSIEGLASGSKRESIVYFGRSLKSSNESKVWTAILKDSNKCEKEEVLRLLSELNEISNIFASSILTMKGKK